MQDQLKNILEQQLRDVHTPEAVSWWPMAIGWWILLILSLAAITYAVLAFIRKRRTNAYRKVALAELALAFKQWETNKNNAHYLQTANSLIKRATSHFNAQAVKYSGQVWVDFLDQQTDKKLLIASKKALSIQCYEAQPNADITTIHHDLLRWLHTHTNKMLINLGKTQNA